MVSVVPIVPVHRIAGNFVRLDIFGVSKRKIPAAFGLMAISPLLAAKNTSPFTKFLGTGHGQKFTASDADLNHWAVLTTWPSDVESESFTSSPAFCRWQDIAHEHRQVVMRPATSVGSWSGTEPFIPHPNALPANPKNTTATPGRLVASITRARVKLTQWRHFQRSVPPVAQALHTSPGLLWAIGIGESPIGWQGTFSVWESHKALRDFAYGGHAHRDVITRTKTSQWYAEELFATFAVDTITGSYKGQELLCR